MKDSSTERSFAQLAKAKAQARALLARHVLTPLFANFTYTIRRGPAAGLKRRGGMDFLPEWIRRSNLEDALLASLPIDGEVAFDVGAWEGVTSLALARRVGPDGQVVAFEPNPAAVKRLNTNLALNSGHDLKIRLVETAISDTRGTMPFATLRNASGRAHFLDPSEADGHDSAQDEIITVGVETIDHLVESEAIPAPGFMKIDVEGAEASVLRGARRTIASHRPVLLLELHGSTPAAKDDNLEAARAELARLGYDGVHVETSKPLASCPATGHLHCWPAASSN